MRRKDAVRVLEDAEYDLDRAGKRNEATDAWLLRRKIEKGQELSNYERRNLMDVEDTLDDVKAYSHDVYKVRRAVENQELE